MEIFESLQDRLPQSAQLQRAVLFGRETGAHSLACVLVRIPPGEQFPLHTHPTSEDCFFVLSGAGYANEPSGHLAIEAPAGVWVPSAHPHGLAAGASGILEIGFQSPTNHRAIPFAPADSGVIPTGLITRSFACEPASSESPASWSHAFHQRPSCKHLDAHYSFLQAHQELSIEPHESEFAVVIASGEAELIRPSQHKLSAFSMVRGDSGGSIAFRATGNPVLLLAVAARVVP